MKKAVKYTVKALKWYFIADVICWAYIGMADWFHYSRIYKMKTASDVFEGLDVIFDAATDEWKKHLNIK